jgi:putative alpha-1,2-mannosidase
MREQYKNTPDGLCGNEDCGQMSAWYIFSALGFYPVDPVSGEYQIGTPLFKRATLHLDGGKTFTITAPNRDSKNIYIDNMSLNGKKLNSYKIKHSDIMAGGTLNFEMTTNSK